MRLYSDRRYIPDGATHVALLAPFWGNVEESPEWVPALRFDRYTELGRSFHRMTDRPEDADAVVLPVVWNHYQRRKREDLALAFAADTAPAGKPLVVFADCDRYEPLPFPNATIFRTSLYRSTQKKNEFATPAWSDDFVRSYCNGVLPVREKQETPVVGFCGLAAPNVRLETLDVLGRSGHVTTNFILRHSFFGGSIWWETVNGVITSRWNHELGAQVRREFVRNLLESDYIVCARGGGNFSHRFYETLICGRVPIFIDTDCVLPYHDAIDWKRLGVWCEASELATLPDKVAEFHARLSPAAYIELQHECRRVWEDRLSVHGFFAHFAEHFDVKPETRTEKPESRNQKAESSPRLAGS